MFVAERFLDDLVKIYGKHCVSTDGGTWSTGLPVSKARTPSSFLFREKPYRENNAVHQRQDRMF